MTFTGKGAWIALGVVVAVLVFLFVVHPIIK